MHGAPVSSEYDLTAIALVMSIALIFGLLLNQVRQPAIVGYILAGAALGPSGFGLVSNNESVRILAELGVLMLLFLIGMELNLKSFRAVYQKAVMTVLLQVLIAVAFMMVASLVLGFSTTTATVLGFLIALSSTAVAIKMLEDVEEQKTDVGRLTLGILIVQDLAVVPMLLITNSLGDSEIPLYSIVAQVIFAAVALAGFTIFLSRGPGIKMPFARALTKNADMATLAIMAFCFSAATLSGILQLSPALGAFLAGMVIGNSSLRKMAIQTAIPVQSILLVIFFLSIGLLIDLEYLWANLWTVLALLFVVTILKTAMNLGILQLLGETWDNAFKTSLFLGQVGEFSFVLAAAAMSANAFGDEGYRLAIAVIALSLMTSPLWYLTAHRFHDMTVTGFHSARSAMNSIYQEEIDAVGIAARLGKEGLKTAMSTAKTASNLVAKRSATKPKTTAVEVDPPNDTPKPPADYDRANGEGGSS